MPEQRREVLAGEVRQHRLATEVVALRAHGRAERRELDETLGGGGGLEIVGGGGADHFVVAYDADTTTFGVSAKKGIAIGPGCVRVAESPTQESDRVTQEFVNDRPRDWAGLDGVAVDDHRV